MEVEFYVVNQETSSETLKRWKPKDRTIRIPRREKSGPGDEIMTSRISLIVALATMLLISSPPFSSKAAPPEYDLIIRSGRVVDGSGRPAYAADVAIKGDRIARIGNLSGARAKRIIDARGQLVAPGFIDMLG